MDIKRAFQRREALLQRLAVIERDGFRLTAIDHAQRRPTRITCPSSVCGVHSEPNWRGNCSWCGYRLGRLTSAPPRHRPDIDFEDVIDPVTLEPVDPHDRDGYKDPYSGWWPP